MPESEELAALLAALCTPRRERVVVVLCALRGTPLADGVLVVPCLAFVAVRATSLSVSEPRSEPLLSPLFDESELVTDADLDLDLVELETRPRFVLFDELEARAPLSAIFILRFLSSSCWAVEFDATSSDCDGSGSTSISSLPRGAAESMGLVASSASEDSEGALNRLETPCGGEMLDCKGEDGSNAMRGSDGDEVGSAAVAVAAAAAFLLVARFILVAGFLVEAEVVVCVASARASTPEGGGSCA